jgi:hypothetical protein
MTTFTAVINSTIYDVCLSTYGTLDHLVKLMNDNNFEGVDLYPTNGQEFLYDANIVNTIQLGESVKYATR